MAEQGGDEEPDPSTSTIPRTSHRPGSRQRRSAAAYASVTDLPMMPAEEDGDGASTSTQTGQMLQDAQHVDWTAEEEREAFQLIDEILAAGMTKQDILRTGIRADVIERYFQTQQANLPSSSTTNGEAREESVNVVDASEPHATASPTAKAKRKRRKGAKKQSAIEEQSTAIAGPSDSHTMDELLRQRIELEREKAKLIRLERQKVLQDMGRELIETNGEKPVKEEEEEEKTEFVERDEQKATTDPMEAMRLAALASMKRKRISNGAADVGAEAVSGQSQSGPPPNAPRGPKAAKPRYHDIDKEHKESFEDLSYDEPADVIDLTSSTDSAVGHALGDAGHRQRPMAYSEIPAPTGQVDEKAPLPSLEAAKITIPDRTRARRGHRASPAPCPSDLRSNGMSVGQPYAGPSFTNGAHHDASVIAPPSASPFLDVATATVNVVLDLSDDEEHDSEEDRQARQLQHDHTLALLATLKSSLTKSDRSPLSGHATPAQLSDAQIQLQEKEREIEALKEKMRLLEQRKKQTAPPVKVAVTETEKQQKVDKQQPLAAFPVYESPFSRFPGLRDAIKKVVADADNHRRA